MLREKLQAGVGRKIATGLAGGVGALLIWLFWEKILASQIDLLSAGQKVAFVAAAFSVTAYNLRTRVIDLILKIDGSPNLVNEFCRIARNCGKKLTNLVVFFTFTAISLGAGGFIEKVNPAAKSVSSFCAALFFASLVQFIYILFAFERLERFMLDDAEKRARDREARRLAGNSAS